MNKGTRRIANGQVNDAHIRRLCGHGTFTLKHSPDRTCDAILKEDLIGNVFDPIIWIRLGIWLHDGQHVYQTRQWLGPAV